MRRLLPALLLLVGAVCSANGSLTQKIGSANTTTLTDDVTKGSIADNYLITTWHYLNGNLTSYDKYQQTFDGFPYSHESSYHIAGVSSWWASNVTSGWWIPDTFYHTDYEGHILDISVRGDTLPTASGLPQDQNTYIYAYDYRGRRVSKQETYGKDDFSNSVNQNSRTAVVYSGGVAVREYAANATATSGGRLPALPSVAIWSASNTSLAPSVEYIRGSDWGGGVGGVLYALHPAAGGTSGTGPDGFAASFYHYDGRGDVVAMTTGSTGTLTYQAAYNAFGQHQPDHHVVANGPYTFIAPGTQEWSASGAKTDRLRASTKEEDPDGLVYYGQRYLRPELGMFASVDPAGDIDGPNRWVLCRQNPWSGFDAEGLATEGEYITDAQRAERTYLQRDDALTMAYLKDKRIDYARLHNGLLMERDQHFATDEAGINNLEATAKWAQENGIGRVNAAMLDDDRGGADAGGPHPGRPALRRH